MGGIQNAWFTSVYFMENLIVRNGDWGYPVMTKRKPARW